MMASANARPIAGGVAILLRSRLGDPPGERYVAIGSLGELRSIEIDAATGDLLIGAAVTLAEVADAGILRERAPLLVAAARAAASLGVRSVATVGGNVVDVPGDSDLVAAAIALGAKLEIRRSRGIRQVAPGTPIRIDELVTGLQVPGLPGAGWALRRLTTQGASDRPVVTVALCLDAERGVVTALRGAAVFIGDRPLDLGGLAPAVVSARVSDVAIGLLGERVANEALAAVDRAVDAGLRLHDDLRATAGYRRSMVGVLVSRAAQAAAASIGADTGDEPR